MSSARRMPRVDPVIALVLRLLPERKGVPQSAQAVRAEFERLVRLAALVRGRSARRGVEELLVDGRIRARLYRPRTPGSVPTVVFFHGGGWVVGSLESYDAQCRRLCEGTGAAVVSVDYRLAPEAPFPAAIDDALAATRWCARNAATLGGDPARLAVAGDSAGANMATVVARELRDEVPLRGQLLIYPPSDSVGLRSGEASQRFPSHERFASGYFLTLERMQWYADQYVPNESDRYDPRASPLRAQDLSGMAPAVIATAGFDPLLDEGRAYSAALQLAGVPVTYLEFPTMIHGYFGLAAISPGARRAARRTCDAFARLIT